MVPHDGEYTVEIHDSIFRGREDFVYRLAVGELPFVTGIFPLGGKLGEKTSISLTGWNLPETLLTNGNSEIGIGSLNGNFFNAIPFAVDDLPECFEGGLNHSVETAQAVTLPIIVNGHVGQPGEQEVFIFAGHAGQQIVAEVSARRLDSPLDSFLRLTDADGKRSRSMTILRTRARLGHVSRRFVSHGHAAGGRNLFHPPHRHPGAGRAGVCLSPAHKRAAAGFCAARRAIQREPAHRPERATDRLCVAPRRFYECHQPCIEGRAGRIFIKRSAHWRKSGQSRVHRKSALTALGKSRCPDH